MINLGEDIMPRAIATICCSPPDKVPANVAILLVEQRVAEALSSCDHGYVLQTGRIALEGVPSVLMEDPHVKEIYLGM